MYRVGCGVNLVYVWCHDLHSISQAIGPVFREAHLVFYETFLAEVGEVLY